MQQVGVRGGRGVGRVEALVAGGRRVRRERDRPVELMARIVVPEGMPVPAT